VPNENFVSEANVADLLPMNFVFICIDDGEPKRQIIEWLIDHDIPFIDVGMGINSIDGRLTGALRITTGSEAKSDHIHKHISFADNADDDYDHNIQIAELNALNAALAVIKWKKMFGVYHDIEHENQSIYEINVNKIFNDETLS
jgi:hypothetical protein